MIAAFVGTLLFVCFFFFFPWGPVEGLRLAPNPHALKP